MLGYVLQPHSLETAQGHLPGYEAHFKGAPRRIARMGLARVQAFRAWCTSSRGHRVGLVPKEPSESVLDQSRFRQFSVSLTCGALMRLTVVLLSG